MIDQLELTHLLQQADNLLGCFFWRAINIDRNFHRALQKILIPTLPDNWANGTGRLGFLTRQEYDWVRRSSLSTDGGLQAHRQQ